MTTTYAISAKVGRVQAGEAGGIIDPRVINGADRYPIVACHGAGSSGDQWVNATTWRSMYRLLRTAAQNGIPSIAEHLGGDTLGNPTGTARVNSALNAVALATGCSDDKAHLAGVSGGAATALNYAIANPSKVASMTLMLPTTSLINAYATDPGGVGIRALIGTAWGVVYPTPLPAGADLLANAPGLSGIPTRLYFAPDDNLINPSDVNAMAAAIGPSAQSIPTDGGGHTNTGLLPPGFDFDEWVDWLIDNGA